MSDTILTFYQQSVLACEAFDAFQMFLSRLEDNSRIIESLLVIESLLINVIRHTVRLLLHIFSTTIYLNFALLYLGRLEILSRIYLHIFLHRNHSHCFCSSKKLPRDKS